MKKLFIASTFILAILLLAPIIILAQGRAAEKQERNQGQTQAVSQDDDQEHEDLDEDENGEDEVENDKDSGQAKDQSKSISPRNETARKHMSIVAQKVEDLLTTQRVKRGIGEQVSVVAKEQQQAQEETEDQLDELEARPDWARRLIGPNYKAIVNLNRQLERNQERIQKLEKLKAQITSQIDKTQVNETIDALTKHDSALQEYLNSEEKTASLLGWFFRMFAM